MRRTRQVIRDYVGESSTIDSLLLTHVHGDHISYYPLRVLEEYGHTIRLHDDCFDQLKEKHFNGYGFKGLNIKPFKNRKFKVREFSIKPFEVVHNPYFPTYGFQIFYQGKKIVVVTDFCEWDSVFDYFLDADFIFVESNHDLKLLEQYYNPNSQFHMPNPGTAELIVNIVRESRKTPQVVMLGHISSQRNKAKIAKEEIIRAFDEAGRDVGFRLLAAPLTEPGEVVEVV